MGITDSVQWRVLPTFCFLGYGNRSIGSDNPRDSEESAKNA